MDRIFDPNAWSALARELFGGHGESSSSWRSEALLLPNLSNLKQISEHVFELSMKPESPSAEIIFFHGLQLNSSSKPYITTWLSRNGTELWLDWLLQEFPDVRILVVSYDASIIKTDDTGRLDMYLTCENLVHELMGKKKASVGETGCPIILVGHCLGGLVLKELCVKVGHLTVSEEDACVENFFQSVKGFFCYSSPHHGSKLPDCNTSYERGSLFEDFNPLNAKTARRNEEFRKLRNKQKWRSEGVGESLTVTLKNFKGLIVPEASSRCDMDKYCTINADHFNVCRPDSIYSTSYTMLAEMVDQIIKKDKASVVSESDLPDTLVGLDSRIQKVQDILATESRIALVGMGGIGKTTLARAVFERIQKSFDYACFYQEVKNSVGAKETVQSLRDKIRARFVNRRGQQVTVSWNELQGKKVLIVLDDTISEEQMQVMTTKDGFSTQSRLIVTARSRGFILRAKVQIYVHRVEELDFDSSKELFCRCAFGEKKFPAGFSEHVEIIVMKCGGLPLALTVTGGFFFSQRMPEWEVALKRFQAAESLNGDAEDGLWSLLKISYEALADKEKEMFLDVATCFHGRRLGDVRELWKYCGWADDLGLGNLLDRHFVKEVEGTGDDAHIFVHEVLRDLGRRLAGSSRMSLPDLNGASSEEVKVVTGHVDDLDENFLDKFSKLKVLWLDVHSSRVRSFFQSDEDARVYERQWRRPSSSTSMDLSGLREMVAVRVSWGSGSGGSGSRIGNASILRSIFTMKSLLFLKLTGLEEGSKIPSTLWAEIGNLERLQALHFQSCSALHQLPMEINKLQKLQSLDIKWCYTLEAIPAEIGLLKNLQYLHILNCSNVKAIPAEIGRLKILQSLHISDCYAEAYPAEIGLLKNLRLLNISDFRNLKAIPREVGQLKSLQSLHICFCPKLDTIPAEIGQLKNLQSLSIEGSDNLEALPAEIGQLKNLRSLEIRSCVKLEAIPAEIGQLKNLASLDIFNCTEVVAIPVEIGQLKNLQDLTIGACDKLKAIPAEIGQLKSLELLAISESDELKGIPSEIGQLENLLELDISGCKKLKAIPREIGRLKSLETLAIYEWDALTGIPSEIGHLENLQSLEIRDCPKLKAIPIEICQLKNLQTLEIHDCPKLEAIPAEIRQLKIRSLEIPGFYSPGCTLLKILRAIPDDELDDLNYFDDLD